MRKFDFNSVKDCEMVFSQGEYVILSGKNPWIFRKDGTYIAKLKQIRNAYNMVFLSGNMVLMDGMVDLNYHYVSLETGEIIWSCPKKGRRYTKGDFAVSPDGKTVYFVYCENWKTLCVDHLEPEIKKCTTYQLPKIPNCGELPTHCYCDNNKNLSLLMSGYVKDEREDGTDHSYSFWGIMEWSLQEQMPNWKYKTRSLDIQNPDGSRFHPQMCDENYVFSKTLTVLSLKTGEVFSLIENSPNIPMRNSWYVVRGYDANQQLLTVFFLSSFSSVIIDCTARRAAAHYVPISYGLSGGCLIDNEFWIGTDRGVIKRPFPHMDEFPRWL